MSSLPKFIRFFLKAIGILCLVVILSGFFLWLGLSPVPDTQRSIILRSRVLSRIQLAKLATSPVVLDFAKIANFDWDNLWIFAGYSTDSLIADSTGYRPSLLCWGMVDEGDYIIVFTLNNRPVEHLYLSHSESSSLSFGGIIEERLPSGIYGIRPFSRSAARFVVRDQFEDGWHNYICEPDVSKN